jgi:hypothetical protein
MKFTKKRIREIIKEEMQNLREEKTPGERLRGNLDTISNLATNLKEMYATEEEPEEWLKEKVAIIEAMLMSMAVSSSEEEKVRVK